jgi:hypothetical protein
LAASVRDHAQRPNRQISAETFAVLIIDHAQTCRLSKTVYAGPL